MTPEREKVVGGFIAAVLGKRFGDGSQEAVDQAAEAMFTTPSPTPVPLPYEGDKP